MERKKISAVLVGHILDPTGKMDEGRNGDAFVAVEKDV